MMLGAWGRPETKNTWGTPWGVGSHQNMTTNSPLGLCENFGADRSQSLQLYSLINKQTDATTLISLCFKYLNCV